MLPHAPDRAGPSSDDRSADPPPHDSNAGATNQVPSTVPPALDSASDVRSDLHQARTLFGEHDLGRVVDRIAHQILEKTEGAHNTVLVGIPTRGAPLARRIASRMKAFEGIDVPVGVLDVTLYRDDLRRRGVRALEETTEPAGGIDDRTVVLVDDVLFSGRTIRSALDALRDLGRPRAVQLAVLVDRGHRELPIRADYVGKNVPTARAEQIYVLLTETDGRDGVLIAPAATARLSADQSEAAK